MTDVVIVGKGVAGVTATRILKNKNPDLKVSIQTKLTITILAPDSASSFRGC